MKKLATSVFILIQCITMSCASDEITKTFEKMLEIGEFTCARASSYKISSNDPLEFVPTNICDEIISTSWSPSTKGGINEYVYIYVNYPDSSPLYGNYDNTPMNLNIKLVNGNNKTDSAYHEFNRIKKIDLEIYEAPIDLGQGKTYLLKKPELNVRKIFTLMDTRQEQVFSMQVMPMMGKKYANLNRTIIFLLGKIIIKDIYPGKNNYTCISELSITEVR